jgi:lactoylglutathione lyase
MAIKKLEHVGVMVKDMETSIAFYRDVVGLDLLDHFNHNNPAIKLAFLGFEERNEIVVELVAGHNKEFPQEGIVHHIAFTVDTLEEEIERLQSQGVTFREEEITTLPNGGRYIFFYGPDEELLELFQPPTL